MWGWGCSQGAWLEEPGWGHLFPEVGLGGGVRGVVGGFKVVVAGVRLVDGGVILVVGGVRWVVGGVILVVIRIRGVVGGVPGGVAMV